MLPLPAFLSRPTLSHPARSRRTATVLTAALLAGVTVVTTAVTPAVPGASAATLDDLTTVDGYHTTGIDLALQDPYLTTGQDLTGLPEGVSVDRVEWVTDRYVRLWINSAAMPDTPTEVELLLPRDWYTDPSASFPTVLQLGGLYGNETSNGWLTATDAVDFYADKNVTVVMPVGGEASYYTDWQQPDNGVRPMWDTFLSTELPAVLAAGWRADGRQAVEGLSMGATSSLNLAARHPGQYDFAAAFSGILDTTSPGMPEGIDLLLRALGRESATNMWGPYGSADWTAHDPVSNLEALRGTALYVSSGSGAPGEYDDAPTLDSVTGDVTVSAVEAMSRMTSQTFVDRAEAAGLPVTAVFHPTGTHRWQYWEQDMHEAWPQLAAALGVEA